MNLPAKLVLCVLLSSFALVGAKARENNEAGNVQTAGALICGTAEQARTFATEHPSDLQAALPMSNTHGAKGTCLFAQVAFVAGKAMDRIEQKNATYAVTEIVILGVATPYGVIAVKPNVAYTVLKVKEETA
jgi:hypothetical protein